MNDDSGATAIFNPDAGPLGGTWSVNVNDHDTREMTSLEVAAAYNRGELDPNDVYVWREGLDDWMPLGHCQELMDVVRAAQQAAAPSYTPQSPARAGAAQQGVAATMAFDDPQAGYGQPSYGSAPQAGHGQQASYGGQTGYGQQASYGAQAGYGQEPAPYTDDAEFGSTVMMDGGSALGNVSPYEATAAPGYGGRDEPKPLFSDAPPKKAPAPKRDDSFDPFDLGNLGGGGLAGGVAGAFAPPPVTAAPPPPPPPPPSMPAPQSMHAAQALSAAQLGTGEKKSKLGLIIGAAAGVLAVVGVVLFFVLRSPATPESTAQADTAASADRTSDKAGDGDSRDKESAPSDEKGGDDKEAKADDGKADDAKDGAKEAKADDGKDDGASGKPGSGDAKGGTTGATKAATDTKTDKKDDKADDKKDSKKDDKADDKKDSKKDDSDSATASSDDDDGKKKKKKKKDKESGGGGEFSRDAARSALGSAAGAASGCRKADGPTGRGRVTVTFAPSGAAVSASVGPPFAGTAVGSCAVAAFKSARVPPFSGSPVTVSKSFFIR